MLEELDGSRALDSADVRPGAVPSDGRDTLAARVSWELPPPALRP